MSMQGEFKVNRISWDDLENRFYVAGVYEELPVTFYLYPDFRNVRAGPLIVTLDDEARTYICKKLDQLVTLGAAELARA